MRHDPRDAMAPLYLGNLLFDLQPEAAIAEWEKAAALGSKVATVYRNLGVGYEQTKRDRTKAIEHYERAVELDPTHRVIWLDAACRARGRWTQLGCRPAVSCESTASLTRSSSPHDRW
jgi:tetratricopeptide (TPR) repeat protein